MYLEFERLTYYLFRYMKTDIVHMQCCKLRYLLIFLILLSDLKQITSPTWLKMLPVSTIIYDLPTIPFDLVQFWQFEPPCLSKLVFALPIPPLPRFNINLFMDNFMIHKIFIKEHLCHFELYIGYILMSWRISEIM